MLSASSPSAATLSPATSSQARRGRQPGPAQIVVPVSSRRLTMISRRPGVVAVQAGVPLPGRPAVTAQQPLDGALPDARPRHARTGTSGTAPYALAVASFGSIRAVALKRVITLKNVRW